ncbi:WAS/WASL-interacting protein family member 2b isoform X2 [Gadus macrocephalus]|uniref:WAS/WASL-interacting protein family member 2b isoform X2 n=1 Tax=Gadus macrocephalus TaxID=80720 RepID=UPI0028CB76BE|nr:WAS/WASL-interacting protein family member 2b isoform X2 [Gadus macrocephalus]
MPIPPPPPPPGGPPPPPTFSQANTTPPKLNREEAKGRGALLTDICTGTRLRKVAVVDDRSAPQLESKSPKTSKSQTPAPTDHPYIRLYQYLNLQQKQQPQQASLSDEQKRVTGDRSASFSLQQPKGGASGTGGGSRSGAGSPSGSVPPIGGLFQGGVPRLRPVGDGSSGRSPTTRGAAPRPPSHRPDDAESPSPQAMSPTEPGRAHRPSLPNLAASPSAPCSSPSSAAASPSGSMKHSSSAPPPPPPPICRRGNAPSPPSSSYNREKPLPPTPNNTPPLPAKPPPSPGNSRRPPTSGGNSGGSCSSLAPPLPHYRLANGPSGATGLEAAPDLPQRHNSLGNKRQAPSPGGHTPTRGPAPPPPPASPTPSQQGGSRPHLPVREPPGRATAPPVPASLRTGSREAPPPPPYRAHDDFESKYSFHSLDDFPAPEEYRHFTKIYPSKANRVPIMRGAPPLPPVGR